MRRLKRIITTLPLLALWPVAGYAQVGVAGDWELTLNTPQGANTVIFSVKQEGDKITGMFTTPMGAVPFTGTATGDTVKVVAPINAQGTTINLAFDAKVSGDALDGKVKFGDFGEVPFTGRRAASPAPGSTVAPPASTSADGGAAGKWDVVLNIAGIGPLPMSATLTQTGEKIGGTIESQATGQAPVTGTMADGTIKLAFTAQTGQGAIPVTLNGMLTATGFAGQAMVTGFGEAEWTGKRAQ